MNSQLKLSALFLACSLALTGCGGSSSDNGNNAGNGNGNGNGNGGAVVSEQDAAKGFVNTLNTMISGVQNIDANYKQVTNLSNNMSNLQEGLFVVQDLLSLLAEDESGISKNYNAQQVSALLSQLGYDVTNSTLTASTNGINITLNGHFDYKPVQGWQYSNTSGQGGLVEVYGDEITTQVDNFKATLAMNSSNLSQSVTLAKGAKLSVKTAGTNPAFVEATDNTVFNSALDRDDNLVSASFLLKNMILNTGGEAQDILALEELSAVAKPATITFAQQTFIQAVPTDLKLVGKLQSGDKKDAAAITLNIKLNNDLSKPIVLSAEGGETATNFAQVDINLAVDAKIRTGDVLKTSMVAKRTELAKAEVSKLEFDLNGKKLMGQLWAEAGSNGQQDKVKVKLYDAQGASVTINDIDQFTMTDIMVNGKSWGTITKTSNGQYFAKFNDNTTKVIAP